MKTAAAYIRVSDERQDEFSPDSQLKLIKEYCARSEYELPQEFIFYDDGISAKSVKKRDSFNNMIALAKSAEHPFDAIMVWKFSRFARNQEESILYKSLLRRNNVEVISVSEPVQDNPFGGLIERIIEWMDEYYLIRLSDEVRRGMTERASRGLPNCAPPFGYNYRDGLFVVNDAEAAVVRDIFDDFIRTGNMRRIADSLRARGIRNRYGNFIDNRGIEYILHNPCYIGYVRWNPNGRSASARNYNNTDDILKKSIHTPIITDDVYNQVQAILSERSRTHQKYRHDAARESPKYMLQGLVKCNSCGATLACNSSTNSLQCHKYSKGLCSVSHNININKINAMVIDALKRAVRDLDFNLAPNAPNDKKSDINYDAQITAELRKLERAKRAYQEGVDTLEEYKTNKMKINKAIDALNAAKQRLPSPAFDKPAFAKTINNVIDIVESAATSDELKNKSLKAIVKEIVFYKPDNHIDVFFLA